MASTAAPPQGGVPTRSHSIAIPAHGPSTPSPPAAAASPRSPFRPPLLALNPGLSAASLDLAASYPYPLSPRSPFANVADAAARSFPSSPSLPCSASATPLSAPPQKPAAAQSHPALRAHLPKKTHMQRVARATREFRDAWIVPE